MLGETSYSVHYNKVFIDLLSLMEEASYTTQAHLGFLNDNSNNSSSSATAVARTQQLQCCSTHITAAAVAAAVAAAG